MKTVKSIELFFQEGTSDKVYNAAIVEEAPGVFTVRVEWGRRGGPLQQGTKALKVPLAKAESELQKIIRQKTKKGYEEVTADAKPAAVAPPVGQGSGSKAGAGSRQKLAQAAQLLTNCDEGDLEALLRDEGIIAQQKLDGARVLVHVNGADEVVATNRSGEITRLADAVLACMSELVPGTIVDGELVPESDGRPCLHAFDLLQHGTQDLRAAGYLDRYQELDAVVEQISGPVRLVPTAATEKEKRALLARLQKERAEGIVFKRRDAPYVAGRAATQLKYKFTKTADVVIVENAGNAYAMVVRDAEGNERRVGRVFAGTTTATRATLDARLGSGERPVAEVQYFYATDDDQLFQPVFVRLRDDKDADECSLDQLLRTSKTVLDVPPSKSKKRAR